MKTFSKLFTLGLVAAGLLLAGCASPTVETKKTESKGTALPLTFEGTLSSDWSAAKGYQNNAAIADVSLDTSMNGTISAGGRNYALDGSGTKTWPDTTDLGTKVLKFVLRTDASSTGSAKDNSHVVLTFKNLDLSKMSSSTGVEFYLRIPQTPSALKNIGVAPILRYNSGTDENAAVYSAPLNDPTAEDFTDSSNTGEIYDWVYFGDDAWLHFKIPFTCFSVPGWASADAKKNATISAALTAGVVFNQFNLDFRFATSDANGGLPNTDYPAYLDNVGLY